MLVVAPGTTVTWTNADDSPHTVREKDGKFKSAALDTDDKFSQTFAAPGEYEYFCSIHPYMTGKIVVKPAGQPPEPERRAMWYDPRAFSLG